MKCSDINSIPKKIDDYINFRKRQKSNDNLFIRTNYIFSREDFITDDYFLCEIILLLTVLSKNAEIYMMKICDLNTEIQEFWADVIGKYIEMRTIRDDDESLGQLTPAGMINFLSKDKFSSKKNLEASYSINKSKTNVIIDFEEQKNLVMNLKKKINQLEKEKNNLSAKNSKNEKEIKEYKSIIKTLNQQNLDIKKIKDEKIFNLEKKIKEYEENIQKLNSVIKENEDKLNKLKKYEEENLHLNEKLMKFANENLVLKTYKEYKSKYESLLSLQQNQENPNNTPNSNNENIYETKEKYLIALKNNITVQKENERLRKEILSLKEELKKEKMEKFSINNNNINKSENGKEINYKLEFEKINLKAERYKYLLDSKDQQIEKLETELEKYKNGNKNENGGVSTSLNNTDNNKLEEIANDKIKSVNNSNKNLSRKINTNNYNTNKKIKYKNLNINNTDSKINRVNKNASAKISNLDFNIKKNLTKEEKNYKYNKNNNSKSEKKKEKSIFNKKSKDPNNILNNKNKNSHNITPSNLPLKNNLHINSEFSSSDIILNPILNLNASVKINNTENSNLLQFLEKIKDNDSINEIPLSKSKAQNSAKSLNNLFHINFKSLLDNIYSNIKKDKKNRTEFISFIKKINQELNLNLQNLLKETNNKNYNDMLGEELNKLKKELAQCRRKESETKLKLTFLQSEKNKLEEEKIKLQEELKKVSQNFSNKENKNNSALKNYYSSSRKVYEFSNLNINSEIGRLTYNIINNSPTKEKNKEEEVSSFEKDRDKKYSFKKKKLINKTPSIEAENSNNFRKLYSGEKNSMSLYEEESNENKENEVNNIDNEKENMANNEEIQELKNKVDELINDKNSLEEKIKSLNENLENTKLKGNNLENINSNLIKENIELKQSLLLIKDNYENEFNLVSSSLINLTEKYQNLKKELLKEKTD